jgi:hypothetical protein
VRPEAVVSLPPVPESPDADDAVILLDEAEGWALWVPDDSGEAVVVHGHGTGVDADDDEEWLFIEADSALDDEGAPAVRCPECGAMARESQIEAWIAALPDVDTE